MDNLTHSRHHSNKLITPNNGGGGFLAKTLYDDVYGGPPKFNLSSSSTSSLSPRLQDYSEIFGAFSASRASSIPVLELPVAADDNDDEEFFDVRSSGFDYSEVFGGFDALDFAVAYDDLVKPPVNGGDCDSSDEAWTPVGTGPLSGESNHSVKNQSFSDGDPYYSFDGSSEFGISYYKAHKKSNKESLNGKTRANPVPAAPAYRYMPDEITPAQQTKFVNPSVQVIDDRKFNVYTNVEMANEKHLRKTVSHPLNGSSGGLANGDSRKPERGSGRNVSRHKEPFVTVTDISLRTEPSHLPPPCRPPPIVDGNGGDSGRLSANSNTVSSDERAGNSSPPFFDVEVDASSSAAVSAAAMKEAMEKARVQLRSAKELMQRKKERSHSRPKSRSKKEIKEEGKVGKVADDYSRKKDDRDLGTSERDDSRMKFAVCEETQKVLKKVREDPDSLGDEKSSEVAKNLVQEKHGKGSWSSQGSFNIDEASEWQEATQYFELVTLDDTKKAFDQANKEKVLVQSAKRHEHGQKDKTTLEGLEQQETDKNYRAVFEVNEPEGLEREHHELKECNTRSKDAEEPRRRKEHEKNVTLEKGENEMNSRVGKMPADSEKQRGRFAKSENHDNMEDVHGKASKFNVENAMQRKDKAVRIEERHKNTHGREGIESRQEILDQEENERRLIEAFRQAEEKRLKEVLEKEENEKRLKEALEQEENEKMLNRALELQEDEKKMKEALERENKKRQMKAAQREENEKRRKEALEKEENEKRLKEALEKEENEKMLNRALELQEDEKKMKEALERENKKRQIEAAQREENEKRRKEALEKEENEKRLKEALEKEENEKRLKKAIELQENEKKLMEALERENKKRLKEAAQREENEKRLKEALELEEYQKRLKEALEKEENEKRLKKAIELQENEKILKEALEQENKKRLKEAAQREENEKRLKEALELEEYQKRENDSREREENEQRLKMAHACEQQDAINRLKDSQDKAFKHAEIQQKLFQSSVSEETERISKVADVRKEAEVLNKTQRGTERNDNDPDLMSVKRTHLHMEVDGHKVSDETCNQDCHENSRATEIARSRDENTETMKDSQEVRAHEENGEKDTNDKNSDPQSGPEIVEPVNVSCDLEYQEDVENEEKRFRRKIAHESLPLDASVKKAREQISAEPQVRKGEPGGVESTNGLIDEKFKASGLAQGGTESGTSQFRMDDAYEPIPFVNLLKKVVEAGSGTETPQPKFKSTSQKDSYHETQKRECAKELKEREQDPKQVYPSSNQEDNLAAEPVKEFVVNRRTTESAYSASSETNNWKSAQQINASQASGRKVKNLNEEPLNGEKETERLKRERELENDRLRKIEEEREREREREKDRMAVDRATLEARDWAYLEARERAERVALERATADARQRAMAEARERLEKACADAREKSLAGKAAMEARLKAERAAVERATAEARERAAEKLMVERERVQRSVSDKYSVSSKSNGLRHCSSSSDLQDPQKSIHPYSSSYGERYEGVEGESAQRCKARLERHARTAERAAKALAEKNMRDLLAQREQAERNRLSETLDADVKRWSTGKEGNLRALLSTLQYILGSDSGWQPIPLTEVITAAAVKKAYRKATLCVHPDKLQQRGASIHQKYICEKVFDLLKEAWNKFNSEER